MVTGLEAFGWLSRVPDRNEARAKIVRYTSKGRRVRRSNR
jgi:DNA-binding MarR family transcriptional regulator